MAGRMITHHVAWVKKIKPLSEQVLILTLDPESMEGRKLATCNRINGSMTCRFCIRFYMYSM